MAGAELIARRHARVRGWLAVALLLFAASAARATTVRPQNLADLVALSDTIVIGTVERVTDGFDERRVPYTEVTLAVTDTLRGPAARTLRFRQFGLRTPRTIDGRRYLGVSPDGWPTWQERERVLLFLGRPARHTGLRTTVGLGQGKLQLRDGTLANAAHNVGLFRDLRVTADGLSAAQQAMMRTPRGPVPADAFVSLVRRAVRENWTGRGVMRHAN